MPWLLLKYALPGLILLGLTIGVIRHFKEHQELQHNNIELTQAIEAKEAVNARLALEIRERDSILARRDVAFRKLSNRLRMAESSIKQANDSEAIGWRHTRLPDSILGVLYSVSRDETGNLETEPADTTD